VEHVVKCDRRIYRRRSSGHFGCHYEKSVSGIDTNHTFVDKQAFFIANETTEVKGYGFTLDYKV
jgi:hypothetical protein